MWVGASALFAACGGVSREAHESVSPGGAGSGGGATAGKTAAGVGGAPTGGASAGASTAGSSAGASAASGAGGLTGVSGTSPASGGSGMGGAGGRDLPGAGVGGEPSGGAAGEGGAGGGDAIAYTAVVTNPIDCCDIVLVTRADPTTSTCVFFEVAVVGPGAVEPPLAVFAFPGVEHCCANDPLLATICGGDAGCPRATSVSGTIAVNANGLDIDLALSFEPSAWLPASIEFRTEDLASSACPNQ